MVLRSIEHKLEALFEGVFGRAFRTNVQPVELARKLTKEMDDHRNVSVSRVYVPNEYTVYLSPDDRAQFASYETSLLDELQQYLDRARAPRELRAPHLAARADRDGRRPPRRRVRDRDAHGAARAPAGAADEPASEAEPGHTMIYRPRTPQATEAVSPEELGVEASTAAVTWEDERRELDKRRLVIGRSRDCDIQLSDPNVSRRHAELRQEGASYWIVDLDSTNGIEINGRRLKRAKLEDGDKVTLGSTDVVFHRES